jgi:hypothetical protein
MARRVEPPHSKSAFDRLAEEGQQAMLRVLPRMGVVQAGRRRTGPSEGLVAYPAGAQCGVTGDGGAVEFQREVAVEIEAHGVGLAVTH